MRRNHRVALAVLGFLGMVAVLLPAGASAETVGNHGSFSLQGGGGQLVIGSMVNVLLPANGAPPQCSDGEDNDGDGKIDLDDKQCAAGPNGEPASDDGSELVGGFQPKVDTVIEGTVDADGTMTIPTSGIVFPPVYVKLTHPVDLSTAIATVQLLATAPATGTIDPAKGTLELNAKVRAKLSGTLWSNKLSNECTIGTTNNPISIRLTTERLPAVGSGPSLSGTSYKQDTGRATLVSNDFKVPGSSSCVANGLDISGLINEAAKLGSPAGKNMMVLSGSVTPILTAGTTTAPNPVPTARITTTPTSPVGEAPFTVGFDASTSTVEDAPGTYAWNFGDGSTATGMTATHTYAEKGNYIVELVVTDANGDVDSTSIWVVVNEAAPEPDPDPDPEPVVSAVIKTVPADRTGVAPFNLSFDAGGSVIEDGPATYAWNFGDGNTSTAGGVVAKTYSVPGDYDVSLTVTDASGRVSTATTTIHVLAPGNNVPVARMLTSPSPATGVAPLVVGFDGSASTIGDGPSSYTWDFGDGASATGATTNHTYATPGTYTAKLTVTDVDGDTDTVTVSVQVNKAPVPALTARVTTTPTPATGEAPLTVTFDASTSTAEAGATGYAWDFGDGSSSVKGVNATHTYTAVGNYTASVVVTDSTGATSTASVAVKVTNPTVDPGTPGTPGEPSDPISDDAVSVKLSGAFSYTNSGSGTGDIKVRRDSSGLVSAKGSLQIPSTAGDGSTATVTVKVERVWILPLWSGEVRVVDKAAKVNVTTPILGSVSSSASTAGSTMSWFKVGSFPNLFRPYTLTWSVTDAG